MIRRREVLAAAPLALAACGKAEETYFGRTDPPRTQRLVYLLELEPSSLDPAQSAERMEDLILSLFEGLTTLHPATGAPMAGVATHYLVTSDGLRYTFYLRGHPAPRGIRLPNTGDLGGDFSRGRRAPDDSTPAQWSDGVPLTAHDFVYSWRRVLEPATAAPNVHLMRYLKDEGVRAIDNFTLEAELRAPTPYFLELTAGIVFCPVPRHAIQSAGRRWTEPGRMVSNGAFSLRERRPYDRIVLGKSDRYHEAGQVALSELVFLVVGNATARVNLYRAGAAGMMFPSIPAINLALRRRKDFRAQPTYASAFLVFNTTAPPFDDLRARYAFNMATDKQRLAQLNMAGSIPAVGLAPATNGYRAARSLPVSVDGVTYDVLSFNPRAARELLSKAKPLPKRIEYVCGDLPDARLIAQVLQRDWRDHLGIELAITFHEFQTWLQSVQHRNFLHLADYGSQASYTDPAWFLDLFSGPDGYGTGWSDPQFQAMLREAKAIADPVLRMAALARCERRLLEAMPILPYSHDVQGVLRKPFVRGLGNNALNRRQFKYAWIDTNWRPS